MIRKEHCQEKLFSLSFAAEYGHDNQGPMPLSLIFSFPLLGVDGFPHVQKIPRRASVAGYHG